MADQNEQTRASAGGNETPARPLELVGDSPELIAFALLRSLAQIEQRDTNIKIDRAWLLNAYAECLAAVTGQRQASADPVARRASASKKR